MTNDERSELEPAGSAELVPADMALGLVADRLVDQARADGVALTGDGGLLTGWFSESSRARWKLRSLTILAMRPTPLKDAAVATPGTGSIQRRCEPRLAMSESRSRGTATAVSNQSRFPSGNADYLVSIRW